MQDHVGQQKKKPWRLPMYPRDKHQHERVATPLELLFDLVFVVAIATAGQQLHHAIIENHFMHVLPIYLIVFFAIWWAWMNFTWFASAYDNDDVPYRITTFVQIVGSLIFASGIPQAFQQNDFSIIVIGYIVMRVAMVVQWIRASIDDVAGRTTARRYAIGIIAVQFGWFLFGFNYIPFSYSVITVLIFMEMLMPIWAEKDRATPWHPHHIAERYSLLTIIVLGESILSGFNAVNEAVKNSNLGMELICLMLGSLMMMFSMWWAYFDRKAHQLLTSQKRAFIWGYGHYFIFASIAAVGAGLAAAVDIGTKHAEISNIYGAYLVAIPLIIYTFMLWLLHDFAFLKGIQRWLYPVSILIIFLVPLSGNIGYSIFVMGLVYTLRLVFAKNVIEKSRD